MQCPFQFKSSRSKSCSIQCWWNRVREPSHALEETLSQCLNETGKIASRIAESCYTKIDDPIDPALDRVVEDMIDSKVTVNQDGFVAQVDLPVKHRGLEGDHSKAEAY